MTLQSVVTRALPASAHQALRRRVPAHIRARLSAQPNWRVGVGLAASPLDLARDPSILRPIFTEEDLRRFSLRLIADPFAIQRDGQWFLFFETIAATSRRGQIGLATSGDLRAWSYQGVVLAEDFHLSYPCVFPHDEEVYLIPESSFGAGVRLYRAIDFPWRWQLVRVLIDAPAYKDATFFTWGGQCWLLVEASPSHTDDLLRLYMADAPAGPWHEHPSSPLITSDASWARPGGRPFVLDGRLIRPVQDSSQGYGRQLLGAEITSLSADRYEEQRLTTPLLRPGSVSWAAGGMHHLDAHLRPEGWVCFVDGRP